MTPTASGDWTIASSFDTATTTCRVTITPPGDVSVVSDGSILLKLYGYPIQLRTTVTSSSGLPDQVSSVSVSMSGPPSGDKMMTQNASITLDWVPEIYTCTTNSSRRTGYQLAIARNLVTSTMAAMPRLGHIADDMLALELRIERTNTIQMECITGFLMMAGFTTSRADHSIPHPVEALLGSFI